jgi:hypothetical protein
MRRGIAAFDVVVLSSLSLLLLLLLLVLLLRMILPLRIRQGMMSLPLQNPSGGRLSQVLLGAWNISGRYIKYLA